MSAIDTVQNTAIDLPAVGALPDATSLGDTTTGHVPYRRAVGVLVAATYLLMPAVYATQPILPVLSHDFHIDASTTGLTLAVFNIALAFSLLIAGPLSDRIGRRPIILTVSVLLVIPTFLAALTPSFGLLLAARAGQGILSSGIAAVAVAYLGDELPARMRGGSIGWYTTALSGSALVGRVGGGLFADAFGWRAMFVALGCLSIIGAGMLVLWLPPAQNFRPSPHFGVAFANMAHTLRSRVLVCGYAIGFLLGVVLLGFFTYASYYLTEPPFNLSTAALGLIFLAYVFGMLAPVAGSISTRIGRRPVIAICLGIMAVGITLTRVPVLPLVILGIVLLALSIISAYGVANAFVGDHAAGLRGGATGLYLCGWYSGGAVGAAAMGPVWAHFGWSGVTLGCLVVIALTYGIIALSRD